MCSQLDATKLMSSYCQLSTVPHSIGYFSFDVISILEKEHRMLPTCHDGQAKTIWSDLSLKKCNLFEWSHALCIFIYTRHSTFCWGKAFCVFLDISSVLVEFRQVEAVQPTKLRERPLLFVDLLRNGKNICFPPSFVSTH